MIQASELRINNWIFLIDKNKNYQITAHDIEEIEGYPEQANPVPLSPELLEKAGFEKETKFDEPHDYWFKKEMRTFAKERMYIYLPYGLFDSMAPCKYLHQLQNLYYALTGTELEVKF